MQEVWIRLGRVVRSIPIRAKDSISGSVLSREMWRYALFKVRS